MDARPSMCGGSDSVGESVGGIRSRTRWPIGYCTLEFHSRIHWGQPFGIRGLIIRLEDGESPCHPGPRYEQQVMAVTRGM